MSAEVLRGGPPPQQARLAYLEGDEFSKYNLQVLCDFLGNRGWQWVLESVPAMPADELKTYFEAQSEDLIALRLSPELSRDWISQCALLPLKISRLKAADAFVRRGREWEPLLLMEEALRRTVLKLGRGLDVKEAAYLIGEGAKLRAMASVVLGLGFQKVYLVSENTADLEAQKAVLDRLFVGSESLVLPAHSLTLQTVGASLLVNTLDLEKAPELAADVAYFNFMKREGFVVDIGSLLGSKSLLEEAKRASLRVIPSVEVYGTLEAIFVESLGLSSSLAGTDYRGHWIQNLTSVQ